MQTAAYTPAESAKYAVQAIESAYENRDRKLGLDIPGIVEHFAPVGPGDLIAIIAQTSNYKSGFMHMWERMLAEQLLTQRREDEVIIHISNEECVEHSTNVLLARATGISAGRLSHGDVQAWDALRAAAIKVGQIPIYRIGHSLARADDIPNLYLSNVMRTLRYVRDEMVGRRLTVAGIFADYLQAFPIDPEIRRAVPGEQRRLQVASDLERLWEMAQVFACPVIVGVQAKQKLESDTPGWRLPSEKDGEETSRIGQRCSRVLTLWMPKMTHAIGTRVIYGDQSWIVDKDLMFVKIAKQRGNFDAGMMFPCRIDFVRNSIRAIESDSHEAGSNSRNYEQGD